MIFDSPEANQRISDTAAEAPPATFMERFQAADKQGYLRGQVLSPGFAVSEDYDRRIKDIKDAGLGDLSDLNPMWNSKPTPRAPTSYSEGHSVYDMEPSKAVEDPHEAFQKKLEQLQRDNPDKAHIIKADKPITGSVSYEAAKKAQQDAQGAYGGPPLTGPIADFAGGMYALRYDPFQLGALVFGPTGPVRQTMKSVLMMGAKQAAVNMSVEAAMQPFVQSWRKSMNDTYGWWDAAEEIGMAGAFGLGTDVGVRMLYRRSQARLGRKAILDENGGVVGYASGKKAAARAEGIAEQDRTNQIVSAYDEARIREAEARNLEIQKNLEALPKDTFDRIAQGDDEATIAFIKATKADEDPSLAGAINAFRNTDRVTLDGIDDGWRERSLLQQLRSLEDPSEPAPVHFDSAAKAERPRLADDAELPRGTEGNQHYRMLELDGKPVRFESIDANRITTEPETFQFKGGRDAAGASNALRAVDFDGTVKGKVIVYEREDGSLVVADGHDRVSLANRAPEPQKLDALIFREKDGWTAEQVRAEAARKNIQEGTGSLMDVAGAIRRHSEIVDDSMAVSTDFMADARSIARLSDEAFDAVAGGQFNPKHGVLVSDHVPDPSRHMEVLRELDRRNPPTEAAARREIGNMLREPANIETLTRVMDIPLAEPHVLEARNEVLAGVLTTLRGEPGYIGEIETQAIASVIRRLSEKPGLVSDTLAQAGRAVAEGQPLERAIDATLRRFEDVIGKAGVKGLADQPVRLSPTDERPRFLATLAGSDAAVGRSMRADLDRLGYYSKALEAAKSLKQSKGTPEQMLAQLKAAGVKDAEIEATNLRSFLDGKTSITRDDIVKHLTENRVGVKEKQYGYKQDGWIVDPLQWGAQGETKRFASQAEAEAYAQSIGLTREHVEQMHAKGKWQNYSLDPSNPTYRETVLHLPSKMNDEMRRTIANGGWVARLDVGDFRSGHFSEPNIIGHMMTSMNRHEGKPVFTLDQIQSDWGQKLRDGGVRDEAKIAELRAKVVAAKDAMQAAGAEKPVVIKRDANGFLTPETAAEFDRVTKFRGEYDRLAAELRTAEQAASGHPLVNTTDQWVYTTLRRALRQAAEADASYVAIPHGDTVLSYNPGDTDGMRGFYGSRTSEGIVPKNLRKLLEKIDKDSAKPALIDKLETPSGMKGSGFTLFPLTDKVKKSILEEGQPLFAKPAENITSTKLNEFAENLRQALDEATTPPPGRLDDPIKDAPKQVERLREDLAEDIAVAMGQPSPAQLAAIRAFHGSPHDFDKFDLSKIGTGEGAQAFGHGLYFAESEGVAKTYRDALGNYDNAVKWKGAEPPTPEQKRIIDQMSGFDVGRNRQPDLNSVRTDITRAINQERMSEGMPGWDAERSARRVADLRKQLETLDGMKDMVEVQPPGRLYEVNIKADPEHFLDWDKPLSQQSEKVQQALKDARRYIIEDGTGTGGGWTPWKSPGASEKLREAGIPGIKYLDQGSRGAGEGSRNYVVFDDSLVEIVAKDGKPVTPEEKKNILADMRRQQAEERAAKQQAEQPQQQAQASPLLDLYQRYSTQGREALDAVMPGTGRMIDEFVQANPEVVARIAEALGAPTGRPQAAQMLEQAMPQFMNPRIIDMSKPVLLTPEANARMPDIRRELDRTVQMLPPEYRIRVEDSLVFNFGDGDKRLDGLHDGYEKLIYVSMAAGDPVRTSRHEVIHALRQSGLMKDEEFSALYKFADRLGLRKAYEIDAQYKEPYTQAYGNRGADFVEQLLREETVANMFSDYSLNGRRFGDVAGGGMVDRLIDMIVSFMKQVRDIMGGYGFRNVYDVFESIESGAMARRGMADAPEASRLATMSQDEPPPLARDLADAQSDREGHDVLGACRA